MRNLASFFVILAFSASVHAGEIVLEYQRADNMMAASGKPSASLGTESVSINAGDFVEFETDWKYEKTKGTSNKRYGSHLRVAKNNSEHVLTLFLRFGPTDDRQEILMPGVSKTYKADLIAVEASPQPLSKGDLAKRCIFEYRRADNAGNQVGLPSNSLGVESVTMRPGERVLFDTNWANEKKKGTPSKRYGSHLRRAVNKGEGTVVKVRAISNFASLVGQNVARGMLAIIRQADPNGTRLDYDQPADFKSDLVSVDCLLK